MDKTLLHLYHSFLFCLGQELERYQELLKFIEDESKVLIQGRLDGLLEFNKQKDRVLLSLQMAASLRLESQQKIVSQLNLDEPVSIKQLIAYASVDIRQNLIHYQEKFTDIKAKLDKLNQKNMDLISFSLSQLGISINYINSLTSSSPNYDQKGQIKAGKLQGRLISQEG